MEPGIAIGVSLAVGRVEEQVIMARVTRRSFRFLPIGGITMKRRKSGSQLTCMGLFLSSGCFLGFTHSSLFGSGKGRFSFFNRAAGVKRVLSASGLRRIVVQHAGGTSLAKCCFFVRLRAVSPSRPVD